MLVLQYSHGPVAQWIERLRPKEKVVRSTRIWATRLIDPLYWGRFCFSVRAKIKVWRKVANLLDRAMTRKCR